MKNFLPLALLVLASYSLPAQIPTIGLIGYWPFNGNANDSSGNNLHGTVTGATLTTDRFGNPNAAYLFGDSTKYITIADTLPLRLSNSDFTISCWVNQSSILSSQEALISKRSTGSQNGYILNIAGTFAPTPGLINFQVSGGTDPKALSDSILPLNSWHHIAVVYKLSNQRLIMYVDGIKNADTTGIPTPNPNETSDLVIGKDLTIGPYAFTGKIDDIAMYNRALSLSEIQQINSPCDTIDIETNIIAEYPFTGNANDISGNNHNGTVAGANLTTDRFGNANMAYAFSGSTTFITVPDQPALRLSNTDFSISAWINQSGIVANNVTILSKRIGAGIQQGYLFHVGGVGASPPRRLTFTVSGGSDPRAVSDSIITVNTWHHVAVVYDLNNQTMKTYIDGVINNVRAGMPSPNAATAANLYIGTDSAGNQFNFNGKIDDIIIYNKSLTACDIDSLFKLPNPGVSGIQNLTSAISIEIFPNPVKDSFTIPDLNAGTITISNIFGQLVKSIPVNAATPSINVADLPAGVYLVSIRSDSQHLIVKKFIKE